MNNLSKTFKYKNAENDLIIFDLNHGYMINKPDGIDSLSITLAQAQGINQIGAVIDSTNIQPRPITVSGIINSYGNTKKDELIAVVKPNMSGQLIAYDEETHENFYLNVYPTATPVITADTRGAHFQFSLLAAYPYWIKKDTVTVDVYPSGSEATNNGHVSVPFKAELTASGGNVDNPVLHCTGNYTEPSHELKLNKSISDGETITIDTHNSIKVISSIDGDISGVLSLDSDFFKIPIGTPVISAYSANSGNENLHATIEFSEEYVGLSV